MKLIPTAIITILNLLMFCKLRKIWKQRRQLKASMGAEAIPVVATPSIDVFSSNRNEDKYRMASAKKRQLFSATLQV